VHNRLPTIPALLAKTDIEEIKRLFGFLHALHMAVYELWMNGGTR
jgi:hypothetical protein